MKKLKTLTVVVLMIAVQLFAVSSLMLTAMAADTAATAYALDFSDAKLGDKLTPVYISGSSEGETEELAEHWTVESDAMKRVNDVGGRDEQKKYAVAYLNGCYFRYFELSTKIARGAEGLTGIVFGKNDLLLRHLNDGNALYITPDAGIELTGMTLSPTATASLTAKDGYYDVKLVVCADYVKVTVDGTEVINKTYTADLLKYGRIGLFTSNTEGAFSGGVEIYNLDEKGNRVALDEYVATTGVSATSEDTVSISLSEEKVKYEYAVEPANATVQDVRFIAEKPDVAVVDNEGYIRPLKKGSTKIYVITADGSFKDYITVKVTAKVAEEIPPEETKLLLSMTSLTLEKVGDKATISACLFPEEKKDGFTWKTSDAEVVTINRSGIITAKGEGTCTITAKDSTGEYSATCVVTVGVKVEETTAEETTVVEETTLAEETTTVAEETTVAGETTAVEEETTVALEDEVTSVEETEATGGCGSVIEIGAIAALLCAATVFVKKKEK